MTKTFSLAAATAIASSLLIGSALAQTAAPAKTTATEAKAPETATEKKARTAISFECSKQADEKKLKGKERKKFRSECKKTATDKAK